MQSNHRDAKQRLLGALGLAARARALIFGTPMICEAVRTSRPPFLVLEAEDTSDGTHKKLTDKCNYYQIKHLRVSVTGTELAHAVGKSASLAAVAVCDEHFCRLMESCVQTQQASVKHLHENNDDVTDCRR